MDIIDENKKIVIDEKEFLEWESGKEDVCYRIIDNQIIIWHFDKDWLAIGEIILIDDKYLQVWHMKNWKKIWMWIWKDIESIKINEDFDSIHLEIIKNKEEVKEWEEGKEKEKEKDKWYWRFECQLLPIQEEEFRIKSVEDYAWLFGETIPEELKKYDDDFFNNGGILSLKYFVRDNTASPTHNIIDIKKEDNTINVSYETENSQSSMGWEVITWECLFIETKIWDSVTWNEVAASDNTNDTNNKGSDVQETEPTNNNLDMKVVETLWTFNGNTFEFTKEPLVDSDNKKYIEINGNKYYEYEEDMNKDWYLINNEKWCIYIWGFKSGAYDGKWVIITRDGDRYEWEFKDGNMEWKGIFIFANWSKYEWEVKENDIEWQGVRTYPNWNKFEWKSACNKMISWKYTIKAWDEEKVYEVIRENGMFKIVDWPDSVGKYLDIEAWDWNEIVDSPKFINLDDLWKFESEEAGNDYKFSFNEEPKNDEKWKYIEFEVRWETEKYYEYQEWMTGKLYRIEEGNDDEIVPYKWIYIWNFEDGKKQWFGAKLWWNWVRYEWEWEDDKPNWRWIFYNREMRTYEWERKDNKKEWYWIETWEDWTRYEWERENDKLNWQWTIFYVNWNRYEWEFVDDAESNWKYTVVEPEEIAWKYEVEKDEKWQKIISWPEGSVGKYMHSSPDPEDWKIVD